MCLEQQRALVGSCRDFQKPVTNLLRVVQISVAVHVEPQSPKCREQLRARSDAIAELLGTFVGLLGRRCAETLARQQERPERDVERDLLLRPLARVRKPREQLQSAAIVLNRQTRSAACRGIVTRGMVVENCACYIPSPLEVRGELCSTLACAFAEAALESIGDRDMQPCATRGRQTLVQGCAVERMTKRKTADAGPVRPGFAAHGAHQCPPSRELRAAGIEGLGGLAQRGRDRRIVKLLARGARNLKCLALIMSQPLKLQL